MTPPDKTPHSSHSPTFLLSTQYHNHLSTIPYELEPTSFRDAKRSLQWPPAMIEEMTTLPQYGT